ncbi:hypothetical protein OROGR_014228 [Orobanche gracilis]
MSECYKHGISLLPGFLDWPKLDQPPILPHQFSKMSGRPKKNRKLSADEVFDVPGPKLSYKCMKMSCRNCGSFEHNRRTCKAPPKQVDSLLEHLRPQNITKGSPSIDKRRKDELEQGRESTEWKKVVKTEGHGHGHDRDD